MCSVAAPRNTSSLSHAGTELCSCDTRPSARRRCPQRHPQMESTSRCISVDALQSLMTRSCKVAGGQDVRPEHQLRPAINSRLSTPSSPRPTTTSGVSVHALVPRLAISLRRRATLPQTSRVSTVDPHVAFAPCVPSRPSHLPWAETARGILTNTFVSRSTSTPAARIPEIISARVVGHGATTMRPSRRPRSADWVPWFSRQVHVANPPSH